jgi:futalosine hydrolase
MEGAAVVHAARRLGVSAIELRVISNTTGDRDNQEWDLAGAMAALGRSVGEAIAALR